MPVRVILAEFSARHLSTARRSTAEDLLATKIPGKYVLGQIRPTQWPASLGPRIRACLVVRFAYDHLTENRVKHGNSLPQAGQFTFN